MPVPVVQPLDMTFMDPSGSEVTLNFRQKPLGVKFHAESSTVSSVVEGYEAHKGGVRPGWKLLRIMGYEWGPLRWGPAYAERYSQLPENQQMPQRPEAQDAESLAL